MHVSASVVVTLGLFLLTHLVASVWWASKVNTLLSILKIEVETILVEIKDMRAQYVLKSDYMHKISNIEQSQKAVWKKIDEMQKT